MTVPLPYCGAAPLPEDLATRFNLDPALLGILLLFAIIHGIALGPGRRRARAMWGWGIAGAVFISPLCALSVALFSARVAQHMILVLLAAPLLALSLPPPALRNVRLRLWTAAGGFFIALWFWHMPVPYDATFDSTPMYWAMHVSIFGWATLLWRELLSDDRAHAIDAVAIGTLSSMQMGLLGAVFAVAGRPLFFWHLTTTQPWGLTPLQDQQLGGILMWVPGIGLFLWAGIRACGRFLEVVPAARSP